jgi:hypothetical protein
MLTNPRRDATSVGTGLASFLEKALGDWRSDPVGKVLAVTFSPKTKSDQGWNFLAIVETGRYPESQDDGLIAHDHLLMSATFCAVLDQLRRASAVDYCASASPSSKPRPSFGNHSGQSAAH